MQKEILKEKIKENYGKIALNGNLDSCCGPQESCDTTIIYKKQMSSIIGYNEKELKAIGKSLDWKSEHSILMVLKIMVFSRFIKMHNV